MSSKIKNCGLALAALSLFWPVCSSSEPFTYGSTGNAAATANSWVMQNVLPDVIGLDVNAVIYKYTTVKDPNSDMLVHVQNKDATGTGYIFRETDNWSGLPGNTISKVVAVNNVPSTRWGDGSIEVEGSGSVIDANVVYSYRVDYCFDPQTDPSCPGYKTPVPIIQYDVYDATKDGSVSDALSATDRDLIDDEAKKSEDDEEEKDAKDRLQRRLSVSKHALSLSNQLTQDALITAMNALTSMAAYSAPRISGGVYRETVQLQDSKLPDNRRGLRNNLAQQLLHKKMVDAQYKE